MADYRKPDEAEQARWAKEVTRPGMAPYKDYPPWGLYQYKDRPGIRHTIIEYFPNGFKFKCGSCDEDHFVPGPALGVMRSSKFNLIPPGHDDERGVVPLAVMEAADLPAKGEPVGIAGSAWKQ